MATVPLKGTEKPRDEKYPIDGKGLFVFATSNIFEHDSPFQEGSFDSASQTNKAKLTRPENGNTLVVPNRAEDFHTGKISEDLVDGNQNRFPKLSIRDQAGLRLTKDNLSGAVRDQDGLRLTKDSLNGAVQEKTIDKLKQTFSLTHKFGAQNLILWGENEGNRTAITSENTSAGEDSSPFKGFITNIRSCMQHMKPSFLLIALVSAGEKSGEFLLSPTDQNRCQGRKCERSCKFTGTCQKRRISDLVRAIQEAEGPEGGLFSGVPKVFLIQTVSGRERIELLAHDHVDTGQPPHQIDPDDYIPRGSDTFVFYVHIEETVQWVNDHGFYLLDHFCDAVGKLLEKAEDSKKLLKEIIDTHGGQEYVGENLSKVAMSLLWKEFGVTINLNEDSLSSAWLDNICTNVAGNMKYLAGADKEHLHTYMSSTMRFRVSMLDVLHSQQ
ncbi:uncharacterized protein [Watersipora subatra]|uniref:uncharacterized protein n=1 Tax=Watersipora subatra TaxID=2589382 RepID=UPI00355C36B2